MPTPEQEERGHVTLDVVDPKDVLASLRTSVATTLRMPVLADESGVMRLPVLATTPLDAALAAAADRLEDLDDLDDDSPTIRGQRPNLGLLDAVPEDVPTTPAAAMVRDALLAATRAALADGEPAVWTDEEDHTMRADRRALAIALGGDHPPLALAPKSPAKVVSEPPALPLPLVRRVDAWIDELPEAARRVLLDARDAQPSWPIVERTGGAVLRPKQRIPSLRPRSR